MNPRLSLLAAALLAASGCVAKGGKPEAPESPKYTFPHSTLPTGAAAKACSDCHDKVPAAPPARRVDVALTFSHADHLPRVNGDCTKCHTALVEPGIAKAPVPPMSTCTGCHNHAMDYAQAKCQPCHVDLKRYRLKPVSDFKHAGDFLRTHGQMARTSAATCAACHEQTSCAECHAATTRPFKADIQWPEKVESSFIHRGDYVSRHVIDASADPASCRRCHGSAFCEACHNEQNVSPQSPSATPRDPHPPGWASRSAHGAAARQNIVSCAGCHDQGARSICVSCHKPNGPGGNPHPPGWTQRHPPGPGGGPNADDLRNNSACRICHT